MTPSANAISVLDGDKQWNKTTTKIIDYNYHYMEYTDIITPKTYNKLQNTNNIAFLCFTVMRGE